MDTKLHETPPAVVILGGSGFVGGHLVTALLDRGCRVAIVSRTPQGQHPIQAGVQWLPFKPDHFSELFKGYCALVNLIGILNEPTHNGRTFEQVHVDLVMQALDAARQAGIDRYLHMSALGADEHKGTSYYQRSKGRAENRVHAYGREHGIQVTSFRPSVIFGPGDSFLNRFAQLARLMPGFFPLACPDARFAPVCVTDVARVMADALNDPATYDQHIDLCGPADYSLREIVDYTARTAGHPRTVIGLPDWAARLQARLLEYAPGKPFTRDNYQSLQVANVCPPGTPRQPTRLEDIAPTYLGKRA